MHLLIDVRTSCLSDIPYLYYAEMWADTWRLYHPDDRITFLIFDGDTIEKYECISVSRGFQLFPKKIAAHKYGPDRVVSFSKFPPIDKRIPHLLHVDELTHTFYPKAQEGFFARQREDMRYKKNLASSVHIIIPDRSIGSTLGEFYGIDDSKISTIPYLSFWDKDIYKDQTILPHGLSGDYFITEWTPWEEWNPKGLIEAFHSYIHEKNGNRQLIILWDIWTNLSTLSLLIRSYGLIEKVKILSVVSQKERSLLYIHAKWWIYIGHYYSRWPSIELANSYDIPLYISDIPWLSRYNGIHIHPNHTDSLADILLNASIGSISHPKNNNQSIMQVYARIISD